MSVVERLKSKFSPEVQAKAQIKKFIKAKIPHLRDGMEEMLDSLFLQVAEREQENPFDLFLMISVKEELVLGQMFNPKKKKLSTIDVGALIDSVMETHLDALPNALLDYINNGLANLNLNATQLLIQELGTTRLIAKYNPDSELIFIEMNGKDKRIVDLDKIINNLGF